jgi:hypothetical protein
MQKKAKNVLAGNFNAAHQKGEFYAEKALVATIGFSDAAPKDTAKAFLLFLKNKRIPHDVLLVSAGSVTFATTRDPGVDTDNAKTRAKMAEFFKGKYADAFGMEGYYQANLKDNEKIIPFHRVKRRVERKFAA